MRLCLAFIALFLGSNALAAPVAKDHHFTLAASNNDYNLLEDVALNAAEATRTVTLPLGRARPEIAPGYDVVRISVKLVQSAATTVAVAFTCSLDNGATYAAPVTRSCVAGACSLYPLVDTYTLSAAELAADLATFQATFDVQGCTQARFVFSGASGGANDEISAQAVAVGGM